MICTADERQMIVAVGDYTETITVESIAPFWNNISYRGDVRARSEIMALCVRLRDFAEQVAEWAPSAPEGFSASEEIEKFCRRHVRITQAYWAALGRTASSMIVGPARFPVARNRKRMDASDNAARAVLYHAQAARKGVKRRVYPFGAPGEAIRSGDPAAIEKLERKLALVRKDHHNAKAINAAWRKEGEPLPSDEAAWQRIANAVQWDIALLDKTRQWMRTAGYRISPFYLTNYTAEAKRLEDRIKSLRNMQTRGDTVSDSGLGFTVRENAEAARIQLLFPDKPEANVRAVLKRNGFRWAPSEGAWQRHLNQGGRYAVECVKRDLGVTA